MYLQKKEKAGVFHHMEWPPVLKVIEAVENCMDKEKKSKGFQQLRRSLVGFGNSVEQHFRGVYNKIILNVFKRKRVDILVVSYNVSKCGYLNIFFLFTTVYLRWKQTFNFFMH